MRHRFCFVQDDTRALGLHPNSIHPNHPVLDYWRLDRRVTALALNLPLAKQFTGLFCSAEC